MTCLHGNELTALYRAYYTTTGSQILVHRQKCIPKAFFIIKTEKYSLTKIVTMPSLTSCIRFNPLILRLFLNWYMFQK